MLLKKSPYPANMVFILFVHVLKKVLNFILKIPQNPWMLSLLLICNNTMHFLKDMFYR